MRKINYKVILFLVSFIFTGFFSSDSDIYFQMSKAIDIFGKVYKEVTINYVDEVNPEAFMLEGIKGMLSTLDPYTNYIDATHQKDIDLITKGKYGGIGATVGLYNDNVTIVDLIEGYSAQRQGMRIGDIILRVDSVEVNKLNYDNLGNLLKREPGTEISITIFREGLKNNLIFNLVSEEIEIKNLTYYGFVPEESNNAYLKLSSFSRSAGEEIRKAIQELRLQKDIKSIILDLRGNPGGLLDAAISVCEKFLPKDQIIVTIKGRNESNQQVYKSKEEPIAGNIRMAVLVDNGSASASEIVAGALQDHDRAVLIGTKSFGKGLVQTVVPLSFNSSIKLTTARYFTPSGRCIQEIDYSKNKEVLQGTKVTNFDSFLTDNKRQVFANGGISPDSIVINSSESYLIKILLAKGMFFKFAASYFNTKNVDFKINNSDEDIFNSFMEYIKSQKFEYRTESEQLISELKASIEREKYNSNLLEKVDNLLSQFEDVKKKELIKFKDDIISEIKKEISAMTDGRKGRILESLKKDEQFATAYNVIRNENKYIDLLSSKN